MTKEHNKIIVTAQLKFPIEIYGFMVFIGFVCLTICKEIIVNDRYSLSEILTLTTMIISALFLCIYLGRRQYVRLVIYADKLVIRRLYSLRPTIIEKDELKGFELFETAVRDGLGYNIRLITSLDKKIALPRDSYKNYDKILAGLHKSGFAFLGQKDLNKTFSTVYGKALKWAAIIFPFVYGLFILLKMLKVAR